MTLRNAFADLATEDTLAETRDLIASGRNTNGATIVGNARTKFRDGFASTDVVQPNPDVWLLDNSMHPDTGDGQGHMVSQEGDAQGASYLRISLSPFVDRSTVYLTSRDTFRMPMRVGFGISVAQRIVGQEVFYGLVEADDTDPLLIRRTPAAVDLPVTGTTASVTTNVATFTIADHGLVGGDRVIVVGAYDTRFNVGPVQVTVVDRDTITLPVTIANGTYTVTGAVVRELDPGSRGNNYFGHVVGDNATVTNAMLVTRRNGQKYRIRNSTTASSNSNQTSTSPYSDAFVATAVNEFFLSMDECSYRSFSGDTNAGMSGGDKFHQGTPDEELEYRLHVRVRNLDDVSRPIARIVSISKTGSTTATVVTDRPHGLTLGSRVGFYGVRDQTAFANSADNAVASVIDDTTFTVSSGASTTATNTQGGVVFVNHGLVNAPGALNFAIQSISRNAKGVLIVTVNTTASGPMIGDWINLWGMTGGAEVYEGAYKLLRVTGSTFELDAPGPAFGSITTGGALIKRTDVRLHYTRVLDHTRHYVEIVGGRSSTTDGNNAVPVAITGSATLSANPTSFLVNTADQQETTANLAANGLFSGTSRDLGSDLSRQPSRLRVMIRHQAGVVHGTAYLEQSIDNTNFYETWRQAFPSDGMVHTFEVPLLMRYYRWRFQNGGTAQSVFYFHTRRHATEGLVELDKVMTFPQSTTALGANATFTGVTIDLGGNHGWEDLRAISYADQAGTLYIDQSRDGTTWRTVGAGAARDGTTGMAVVEQKVFYRYVRTRYVNGAVAQGTFSLDLTMSTN